MLGFYNWRAEQKKRYILKVFHRDVVRALFRGIPVDIKRVMIPKDCCAHTNEVYSQRVGRGRRVIYGRSMGHESLRDEEGSGIRSISALGVV